ncbi:MAG TPA: SNF2-related protein [bacterium]|nr:SNF2-related protein [bacterium]
MRAKHVFGLTPWGRYFIEAMEGLADEGRLTRGRSYAGSGAVLELDVKGGVVTARVAGHYRPYYRVVISFKPLPARVAALVGAAFDADPLLAARVSAGDLPAELIEGLAHQGVSLVPRSWSDMQRSCSCPDHGDPCKHEAAVYYLLAQEIDRDPLVLFRLRGIDPSIMNHDDGIAPGSVSDPLVPQLVEPWPDPAPAADDPLAGAARLSPYVAVIPALLPPSRGLAPFDLRVLCTAMYIQTAGRIPAILEPDSPGAMDGARARTFAASGFQVELRADGTASIFAQGVAGNGGALSMLAASRLFAACDERQGSASYLFLRGFFAAARSLASACAFVPDVRSDGTSLAVIWKPARFASDVDDLLTRLEPVAIAPVYVPLPGKRDPVRTRRVGLVPDRRSTMDLMATAFLSELVAAVGFMPPSAREARHPVARALFGMRTVDCSAPGQRALPGALDAWVSVFDLASRRTPLELTIAARRSDVYQLSAAFIADDGRRVPIREAAGQGGQRAGEALSFAALLSNFVPALGRLGAEPCATLGSEELAAFVMDAAPLLGRFGVAIVLPKDLRRLATPRPALRATAKASLVSYLDLASAFSFDWSVAIGDQRLSVAEFATLVESGLRLVRWRGEWIRIDPAEAARLMGRVSNPAAVDAMDALRTVLSGDVALDGELPAALDFLVDAGRKAADDAPVPSTLQASLRPYQERGYRWMLGNFERGLGCLLADDMGLGKTVQAIAAMLYLKDSGGMGSGALVCAPASLLSNWERELSRFAPSLSVCVYYGSGRRRRAADVTLSSYETWMRDQKKLADIEWRLVVLDEAHYIKNPGSRRTLAVKAIRCRHRLALTGTPVENNLAELWSVFDFALPGYLGTLAHFSAEYRRPIEFDRSEDTAARLRAVTAPFIMRRLKTDPAIAIDLPDKVVVDEYACLTPEQAALYEAVASDGLARISAADPESRLGAVLALITSLKQVSNHPRNYDKESPGGAERSGKSRLLVALLESALEAGERVLVFSQYVQMLDILTGIVRDELGVEPYVLHGGMSRKARDGQVTRFQSEPGSGVFLISLKAGGVGLNLTAATRVVHYDLWFNPAVENQATDRAFRIGQTKNVFVHRLVARDTIEERIDAMISAKRGLSELSVRAGESWIADLDDAALRELVALR